MPLLLPKRGLFVAIQASVTSPFEEQIRRHLTQALELGTLLRGREVGCYTLLWLWLHLKKQINGPGTVLLCWGQLPQHSLHPYSCILLLSKMWWWHPAVANASPKPCPGAEKVLAVPRRSCARRTTVRIWWWNTLWPCVVYRVSQLSLETSGCVALRRKVAPAPQLPISSLEEATWSWVLLSLRAAHSPGCGVSQVVSRPTGLWCGRTTSRCPVQLREALMQGCLHPPAHLQQHPLFSPGSRRRLQRGVSACLNCLLPPPLLGQMPKIAVELCLNYSPKWDWLEPVQSVCSNGWFYCLSYNCFGMCFCL